MQVSTHSRIRLLDEATVHRIAAGEVVDRPASVLKELIENCIDAGATKLKIQVVNGGIDLIEIDDDGIGMDEFDLQLCLKRHATSKIRSAEDLEKILTLGFRGEALAAVGSVAKLRLESCFRGSKQGWVLEHDQHNDRLVPYTRLAGTKVIVKDLFYNTPARRQFLKSPGSEASACIQVLWSMALSHPEITFEWFVVDAKGEIKNHEKLPKQSSRERFIISLGCDAELLEVFTKKPVEGVNSVTLLAARAPVSYRSQNNIHLLINGRYVYDKKLSYALREAYTGLIEIGTFPAVWASLDVDPAIIDVNIHPQKKELRWPKGFSLGSVIYNILRPHLEIRKTPTSVVSLAAGVQSQMPYREKFSKNEAENLRNFFGIQQNANEENDSNQATAWPIESRKALSIPLKRNSNPPFKFAELRVVGEVGASWLVLESPQGIVLIDQHAAHERINYEKILSDEDLLRPKPLLFPIDITLPLSVTDYREELVEILESFAFECSDLDTTKEGHLELLALPESDRRVEWEKILEDLFERIEESLSFDALKLQVQSKIAASLACHGSIRRGQRLNVEQIKVLMQDLDRVDWGAFCPHGRPVWLILEHQHIEDLFHR